MTDICERLRDHENEGVTASDRFAIRKLVEEQDTEIKRLQGVVLAYAEYCRKYLERAKRAEAAERAADANYGRALAGQQRAEAEAAELREQWIDVVQRGIIDAPCPTPLQWKLMQEKFRPMIAALAAKGSK